MPYLHVYVIINSCLYGSKTVLAARARNDGQLCSGQHAPHTNGHNGYALLFDSHIQYIYCMWKTYISHSKTARTQTEQRTRFDSIAVCERRGAINTMRSDFLAFASYWGFDINWHVIFRLNSWALYSLSVCFFFFSFIVSTQRARARLVAFRVHYFFCCNFLSTSSWRVHCVPISTAHASLASSRLSHSLFFRSILLNGIHTGGSTVDGSRSVCTYALKIFIAICFLYSSLKTNETHIS